MIPALKLCYVRLNRDFGNENETPGKGNFPMVEIDTCKKSNRNLISAYETSSSKVIKRNCSKPNEFSFDSSSSEEDDNAEESRKSKQVLSKTNPKKLKCLLCNKFFISYVSYIRHKRSHESRPFKCILCGKGCQNRQSFLNHMKKLHPEVDPFVCEYPRCEQSFITEKRLEIHNKMHMKYMCKYCKKLFVKKHYMRKHVLKIH